MSDERIGQPDPTALTTEQLHRQIGGLRELLEGEIGSVRELLEREIGSVRELFAERDRRYAERFDASQAAVRAAFEAAEKAILKAEVSIEKRADATYVALAELQRMLAALMPRNEAEQRYADIADRAAANASRLDRLEAAKAGAKEDRSGLYAGLGAVAGLIFLAIAIVAFLAR